MLRHIQIRNLVIVQELSLDLPAGMAVLTGETGAGKSILIDALGLALGGKTDRGMIRPGCETAEVSAVFDLEDRPGVADWLDTQELASDGECIVRRVLVREGRSRAFVNGRPVTQQLLRELGEQLVEIHGQHEHQRLLRPAVQRQLLDAWAGHDDLLRKVSEAHARWQEQKARFEQLQAQTEERAQRMDYLQYQIGELERLRPAMESLQSLEQEQKRLANADELGSEVNWLLDLLQEADGAVQAGLSRAALDTGRLTDSLAGELAPAAELLESARIQVEEAVSLLQEFGSRIEHDPQRLAEVDHQLGELHDMARKHRTQAERLPGLLEALQDEFALLENAESSLAGLERELESSRMAYLRACTALGKSRRKAATRLSGKLTASMQELAMEGGRFEIEVGELSEEMGKAHGLDEIRFLVSANPGQPLAPLAKVASGGELSRLSLAIQVATADIGTVPTLIFDEVDVGIGGAVAETVGRLLRELGKRRQVLCVTHLPQVAAQGHAHFQVSKERKQKSTRTRIIPLDEEARIREIARMVGGSRITPQTLAHAREMISGV
ncbi:MAG: DNA repair protein RecN [Gammaproteobacteria bacterium]|nr:MAG: DNA repair protein RecN [Gammaproteobacteria bacterium]RTZ76674.1 MAG: DNA repair protein RecN [Gammaproteobacteria bacterium]